MNSVRDLEMSKNRNQKVLITDEAINKVPLIKYRGIPENEYATIEQVELDSDGNVTKVLDKGIGELK